MHIYILSLLNSALKLNLPEIVTFDIILYSARNRPTDVRTASDDKTKAKTSPAMMRHAGW